MSDDDLFWPPLSGEGDDSRDRPTKPLSSDATPTEALPAESILTEPDASDERGATWTSRRVGTATVVAITAFGFGIGGISAGALLFKGNDNNSTPDSFNASGSSVSPTALTTSPKSYAGIAAKVLPSVVSINVAGSNESDTGSGIVLQSDGYILTNNHVVAAAVGGGTVSVSFNDGTNAKASIVGTDSLDDLAVIKVDKTGLTAASLGDSSNVQVGDPVLAIGSPLGLSATVTSGIVSALNRPVETQDESQQSTNPFGGSSGSTQTTNPTVIDAIQTDAAINPGNSGGALVNATGQVIGINSAIASLGGDSGSSQSGNIGVGFAIPINQAKVISKELIANGKATHPLLGVSLQDRTTSFGTAEALVHTVSAGGPAAGAGIKTGDVITAIDGLKTEGTDAVIAAVRSHQAGQVITVAYERDGSSHTVHATLTAESSSQTG